MLFILSNICIVLLATVVLSNSDTIKSEELKQLPEALQNVLRRYGKKSDFDIEFALRPKIVKLIPFLDDHKYRKKEKKRSDLRNLEDDSLIDSDSLNNKYKRLRKDIEKLLKIEPVSEDTKIAIAQVLDQITDNLMSNNCLWKKKAEDDDISAKTDATEQVMKHIKRKWKKIFDQYSIKKIEPNETARKAFALLTGLRTFVFDIHEDYKRLESRYAMKCDIIDKNKQGSKKSLEANGVTDCDTVCSGELLTFMTKFYIQLKGTYSDVLNNYMRMYRQEVNEDLADESLENYMNKMIKHIEKKAKNNFEEAVEALAQALKQAKKRSVSAFEAVSNTVDITIDSVKKIIEKSLQDKLRNLSPKLRMTVREDLRTTSNIELGNLRQDIKNSICAAFQTCNSIPSRKHIERDDDFTDPNTIRLNLKLGFDKTPLNEVLEVFNSKRRRRGNVLTSGPELHYKVQESKNDTDTFKGNVPESETTTDTLTAGNEPQNDGQKFDSDNNEIKGTIKIEGSLKKVQVNDLTIDLNKYKTVNVTRTSLLPDTTITTTSRATTKG